MQTRRVDKPKVRAHSKKPASSPGRDRTGGSSELPVGKITELVAVLAHELRNPLAPIRNAASLLRNRSLDEAARQETFQILERQSEQLARILDDLLDATRISRGILTIRSEPTSIRAVVARAMESAAPFIKDGDHTLTASIPDGDLFVRGDEIRLAQALTNILNNAARYSEPYGRVHLSVQATDGPPAEVRISIEDEGHGIAPSQLESIFDMFVQVGKGTHMASTGLGIGLAIARSIVVLHGGHIEATSDGVGKGSRFCIRLPLLEARSRPAPARGHAGQAFSAPAQPSRRVLVVDDNADAATVLATLLRSWGHEVLSVNTGADALAAADRFRPEIVLLDLGMPEMDGFTVARRLRTKRRKHQPVIVAVTGWGSSRDIDRTRQAGFDGHLVKPVETADLVALLDRVDASLETR